MPALRASIVLLLASGFHLLGGCSQDNSGDEVAVSATIPTGIERFLLFPNPVVQPSGAFETDTAAYASAYYAAIDPGNQKDTFAKWTAANGFGSGGEEYMAVFRDVRDLGYGRRMTGRRNADGSIAFSVDNYHVSIVPGGGYTRVNLDAAVAQDAKWHVGTNTIEWSCAPLGPAEDLATCRKFAKFFNFSSTTGQRQLTVNLDGRGPKAMPGPCLTCHGGRVDPLTPIDPGSGQPRFALLNNSVTGKRGDAQAKLQPFNVDSFEWSTALGFSRAEQETTLKIFNQWVLCSYPLPGGGGAGADACRQTAAPSEWEGTAAEMIHAWYGGPGMPNAQFSDTYVPAGWAGHASLYRQVIAPYCRTCHIVRGTGLVTGNPPTDIGQKDIDLSAEAQFRSFLNSHAERTKVHVFDRGNMPLALLVYGDFWDSPAPAALASYLDSVLGAGAATSAGGAPLQPGRPIAEPGPDRMVRAGANATLSAVESLFATTYGWSIAVSPPGGDGVISNADSQVATFLANMAGDYTIRLTVTNGSQSHSRDVILTVSSTFPDPGSIRLAQVLNLLRNVVNDNNRLCVDCHRVNGVPNNPSIAFTRIDRDGDGFVTATDDEWLLQELRGRVNLTEIRASPLLRRPTGKNHGTANNLNLQTGLTRYSQLYHWILNGMPAGGVAANAGAESTVTFSPPSTDIALDGSASIGATSYSWSILSGPAGASVVGADPISGTATLRVLSTGVYVVQLQATDGALTDTAPRRITVN